MYFCVYIYIYIYMLTSTVYYYYCHYNICTFFTEAARCSICPSLKNTSSIIWAQCFPFERQSEQFLNLWCLHWRILAWLQQQLFSWSYAASESLSWTGPRGQIVLSLYMICISYICILYQYVYIYISINLHLIILYVFLYIFMYYC